MSTTQPLRTVSRLLAPANRRMLLQWAQDDTLFVFDFDGTLAPCVDDPEQAFMARPTWRALAALSAMARVAVISGRCQTDLRRRLPAEVAYAIGNHGNEGRPVENLARRAEHERCCKAWGEQLSLLKATSSQWWANLLSSSIENKGISLSLHYRHCADPVQAREILLQFAISLSPAPQIVDGLSAINLLPPHAHHKSDALTLLMAHSGCARALFVGDDDSDESAFASAPDHWLTARVGYAGDSCARYRLANTREVRTLMELAARHRQTMKQQTSPALWP